MTVDPSSICRNNIEIAGTGYTHLEDFRDAIKILSKMDFPYGTMVTDRFGIDDVTKALQTMISRECMKVVIDPTI